MVQKECYSLLLFGSFSLRVRYRGVDKYLKKGKNPLEIEKKNLFTVQVSKENGGSTPFWTIDLHSLLQRIEFYTLCVCDLRWFIRTVMIALQSMVLAIKSSAPTGKEHPRLFQLFLTISMFTTISFLLLDGLLFLGKCWGCGQQANIPRRVQSCFWTCAQSFISGFSCFQTILLSRFSHCKVWRKSVINK